MHVLFGYLLYFYKHYKTEGEYFQFDLFFQLKEYFFLTVKLEAYLEKPHRQKDLEGKEQRGFHWSKIALLQIMDEWEK